MLRQQLAKPTLGAGGSGSEVGAGVMAIKTTVTRKSLIVALSLLVQGLLMAVLSTQDARGQVALRAAITFTAQGTDKSESKTIDPTTGFSDSLTMGTAGGTMTATVQIQQDAENPNHWQIRQFLQGGQSLSDSSVSGRVDVNWQLTPAVTASVTSAASATLANFADGNISEYALLYLSAGGSSSYAGCTDLSPGNIGVPPGCTYAQGTSGNWPFQATVSPVKGTTTGTTTIECSSGVRRGAACAATLTTDILLVASNAVTISEVDNGFSNVPNSPLQPTSWGVIKGKNLSTNPGRGWNANESFPTSMDGTSVTINNKPAFLYYISPTQLNLQAPTDGAIGPVSVVVTNNGATSAPATAQYQSSSPALLQWNGGQYPYAEITRGSDYIGNPAVIPGTASAKAGDILTLWATGLGDTNPPLPAGQQPTTLPSVNTPPTVTVGGLNATVLGAVLRYAGLYQVNIQLPSALSAGDAPIKLIQGSYQSPDGVLINIAP